MILSLALQLFLFIAATAAWVRALRALPTTRIHAAPVRPKKLLIAVAIIAVAPLSIGMLGQEAWERRIRFDSLPSQIDTAFSAALLALSCALLWIAVHKDPARGRKRCGRCWCDMSAVPSRTCPECGHAARDDRGLFRTRRSARLAALALPTALASYAALKLPRVSEYGWGICIPTTPMIIALPFMPEAVITDDNQAYEWDLWDRWQSDLWPWQDAFLEWHAARIISRSTDLDLLARASTFVHHEGPPYMNDAAVVRYVQQTLAGDDAPKLDWYLPEAPGAAAQDIIAALVKDALAASPGAIAGRAATFSRCAPRHSSQLADVLAERIATNDQRSLGPAMVALGQLAKQNDHAWDRYRAQMKSPDSVSRQLAVRWVFLVDTRSVAALPLLEASLEDPNDRVVVAAVKSLRFLAPDFRAYRERLLGVAQLRTQTADEILSALCAERIGHPHVLELARSRLSAAPEKTLDSITMLGNLAAPLRLDLETFGLEPEARHLQTKLRETMDALDLPPE